MKNLIKIISAISLIGTASTSVIACENKINTIQKINNVIKNKLLGDINIGILTIPTPQKIKFVLKKQNPNLDIDAIAITNITNENCNVTGDNKSYIGTINVNYSCSTTNKINFKLDELPKNLTITNNMNGLQLLDAIRSAIVSLANKGYISNEELKSDQTLLWSAWISNDDPWNYEQIWSTTNLEQYNNGNIIIKINIKTDNLYFNQIINWEEIKINIKTDFNILADNIRTIDNIKINDINSFVEKLVISFRTQREFNNLKKDDIDLFKKDSTIILDKNDIVANANLEITVEAKKLVPYL
ncbi:hypothetical protein [Spiroplasma endosymbiont of Polydrusus pterygomalis]|uniref:hypothetical protein n=1 Tax=Spiroplasma endosymbiont of Polydrusus pterygomalis TaxID=3139327 RepID=UPI003CCB586E